MVENIFPDNRNQQIYISADPYREPAATADGCISPGRSATWTRWSFLQPPPSLTASPLPRSRSSSPARRAPCRGKRGAQPRTLGTCKGSPTRTSRRRPSDTTPARTFRWRTADGIQVVHHARAGGPRTASSPTVVDGRRALRSPPVRTPGSC